MALFKRKLRESHSTTIEGQTADTSGCKQLKQKRKKHLKMFSFIFGGASLFLTAALLLTFLVFVPSGREKDIQALIDSGKYNDAIALIQENGNYGDTKNLEYMCKAGMAFEEFDYEKGIDYINYIGGTVDVAYDSDGGNCSKITETIKKKGKYIDNDSTKDGYLFNGWALTGYSIKSKAHYASIDLKALYSLVEYNITYVLDGGINDSSNPISYTVEDSITLKDPTKIGFIFLGWFNNSNEQIVEINGNVTGDLTLTAKWDVKKNNLSVTSEDETKGTVEILSGSGYTGETITVKATPIDDCVFRGWYHEDTLLNYDDTYSFIMPANDYSLVARFFTKEEEEAKRLAKIPCISEDGTTITYGLYPQTNVNDSSLIEALNNITTPEDNGWYLYNGEYYAKTTAKPYSSNYTFDNGTIISEITYWFKCEPITWNVLSNDNGEYYIVSSVLLDTHCYYNSFDDRTNDGETIYANNYQYSDIRIWLNEDFYNSAFALGNEHIQLTTVDNSASTTNSSSNSYACENTSDKVFLPSYEDYLSTSYGFEATTGVSEKRECKTTDWARARGAWYSDISSYYYNSYYWTRSPISGNSYSAWGVDNNGYVSSDYVDKVKCCVRPGLKVRIA